MTTEEFKEITRAVVLALREELTPENKDVLDKLTVVEEKLNYNGAEIAEDISAEPHNNLCRKIDGLYVRNNYVTTESSPIGEIIAFMGTTAPEHYLSCDGTEYTIGTYPLLEAFFIEQFGSVNYFGGDGTTTFAVPDLRGEFLRGSGSNIHANQGSGSTVGAHQDATEHLNIWSDAINTGIVNNSGENHFVDGHVDKIDSAYRPTGSKISYNNNRQNIFPSESDHNWAYKYTSRPTNTSVMYCIKYESTSVDEVRFLVTRPDLWPENTEVDLGNGLYGIRKCGVCTSSANAPASETIITDNNINIMNFGGWLWVDDNGGRYAIGQNVNSSVSCVFANRLSGDGVAVYFWSVSPYDRTNAPYEVWATYTKPE